MGTAVSGLTAPAKMVASADPVLISAKTASMISESAHVRLVTLEDTVKRRKNKISRLRNRDLKQQLEQQERLLHQQPDLQRDQPLNRLQSQLPNQQLNQRPKQQLLLK